MIVAAGLAAKSLLSALAMMGLHGSVLALAAFAIVRVGRLRPSWQAAIWLVVIVKFALPWGPALPWSLADVIAALRGTHGDAALVVTTALPAHVAAAPSIAASLGWLALAVAWFAGATTYFVRALLAGRAAARAARTAPLAPPDARALLAILAPRHTPDLVVGDADTGPHVVGILFPTIVVPPAIANDPRLLRAVLLHELAHVRRRDAIGRAIQLVATSLFFFWPVARLAARRLDAAREAACDAWAIETGELSPPAYARLLLHMAQLRAAAAPALAANALDSRVASVLAGGARRRIGPLHALVLVAWVALALGGARSAAARGEVVCSYTPQLALALYEAHPEADLDGDGVLSRTEACELQAELRQAQTFADNVSRLSDSDVVLLAEPLCCNCDSIQRQPETCQQEERTLTP